MVFLRIILYPFSLIFGLIIWLRNKFYDWQIFQSTAFDIPIISVGNISAGGTGKSPQVEYLIRLLRENYRVATLSRGYKRNSKGFLLASNDHTVRDIGDEPMQFKSKFEDILVAVDEKRVHGVNQLLKINPPPEVILLDDAFQHRQIKAGLSILLTDFYHLYAKDYMIPSGKLREFRAGTKRADAILVTKSPKVLSPFTRQRVRDELKPLPHQQLFFSYIRHSGLTAFPGTDFQPEGRGKYNAALIVAGIANPYPLEAYLKEKINTVETYLFPDHHQFTGRDVENIIERFDQILSRNKILVTTEKDMMRLIHPSLIVKLKSLPLCFVPMETKINKEDREQFDKFILQYVKKARGNNKLHQAKN